MTIASFPWLSQALRPVYSLLDQKETGEAGQTYSRAEIVQAANDAQNEIHQELTLSDRGWSERVTDAYSITSGTRTITLPADCRNIRLVSAIDSSGEETGEHWTPGTEEDAGVNPYRAIYRPALQQLYLTTTPTSAQTLRIWYVYYPLPIIHGIVQASGAASLTLESHESDENDTLIGVGVRIWRGTGLGQERTISDSDGGTKVATISAAWSAGSTPNTASWYTSRPDLPAEAEIAWRYRTLTWLVGKNHGERYDRWNRQYEDALALLKRITASRTRMGAEVIRDLMPGGWSTGA